MLLKKLNQNNLGSLYKLGLQEFKGQLWYTKSFLKDSLNSNGYNFGAYENKKLIGYILVRKMDRPKMWILVFIVDKDYRRQSIGVKLLKKVESFKSKDYYVLMVDAGIGITDVLANNFYKKSGFERSNEIKHWFGTNNSGYIYLKNLDL